MDKLVISYHKRRRFKRKGELVADNSKKQRRVCQFCLSGEDNEVDYGTIYEKGDVTVHYFCMLLASGLCQNGRISDKSGILGFLLTDIKKELVRGSRLKCCFCHEKGATIGCCVKTCRKAFHLSCGRQNGTMHQFFNDYRSYCGEHRLIQTSVREAKKYIKRTCAICMSVVTSFASCDTLISPCCRRSWFHRLCMQQYALSAGLHYFKCPLCNATEDFQADMLKHGIYIPDRDASWEREPNAFHELLERHSACDAPECRCPRGRNYDANSGQFDLLLCEWCGSSGSHKVCNGLTKRNKALICSVCMETLDKAEMPSQSGSMSGCHQLEPCTSQQQPEDSPVVPFQMRSGRIRHIGSPEREDQHSPTNSPGGSSRLSSDQPRKRGRPRKIQSPRRPTGRRRGRPKGNRTKPYIPVIPRRDLSQCSTGSAVSPAFAADTVTDDMSLVHVDVCDGIAIDLGADHPEVIHRADNQDSNSSRHKTLSNCVVSLTRIDSEINLSSGRTSIRDLPSQFHLSRVVFNSHDRKEKKTLTTLNKVGKCNVSKIGRQRMIVKMFQNWKNKPPNKKRKQLAKKFGNIGKHDKVVSDTSSGLNETSPDLQFEGKSMSPWKCCTSSSPPVTSLSPCNHMHMANFDGSESKTENLISKDHEKLFDRKEEFAVQEMKDNVLTYISALEGSFCPQIKFDNDSPHFVASVFPEASARVSNHESTNLNEEMSIASSGLLCTQHSAAVVENRSKSMPCTSNKPLEQRLDFCLSKHASNLKDLEMSKETSRTYTSESSGADSFVSENSIFKKLLTSSRTSQFSPISHVVRSVVDELVGKIVDTEEVNCDAQLTVSNTEITENCEEAKLDVPLSVISDSGTMIKENRRVKSDVQFTGICDTEIKENKAVEHDIPSTVISNTGVKENNEEAKHDVISDTQIKDNDEGKEVKLQEQLAVMSDTHIKGNYEEVKHDVPLPAISVTQMKANVNEGVNNDVPLTVIVSLDTQNKDNDDPSNEKKERNDAPFVTISHAHSKEKELTSKAMKENRPNSLINKPETTCEETHNSSKGMHRVTSVLESTGNKISVTRVKSKSKDSACLWKFTQKKLEDFFMFG